ncbi:MAG: hypothetical protein KDC54_08250 [Lewinella sp.]|nr:hypothetical protein [Lewinella sp.]
MRYYFDLTFNWADLLVIGLALLLLRMLLQWAYRLIIHSPFLNKVSWIDGHLLRQLQVIYEPLAVLLLLAVFVLINPVLHGILVAASVLLGFAHCRNYLTGRLMQLDEGLRTGQRLRSGTTEGAITALDRLGLKLRTEQGLHFITYSDLMTDGYLLLSGQEIGGLYHLHFQPTKNIKQKDPAQHLLDLLTTTPYIDGTTITPVLSPKGETPEQGWETQVLLRDNQYLPDFLQLVKEWGYDSIIIQQ